jgi:hypothetical protein
MGKKKKKKKTQQKTEQKQPKKTVSASTARPPSDQSPDSPNPNISSAIAPDADKDEITTDASDYKSEKDRKAKISATAPKSRFRRMLPDILRVFIAFTVILIGVAIWLKPPLISASFPLTTFSHKGGPEQEATLYRPIAMQERYYVELPEMIADRYQWFAIDRRREEVALCDEPIHRFFGKLTYH